MVGTADTLRAKLFEREENTDRERDATRVAHHVCTEFDNRRTSVRTTAGKYPPTAAHNVESSAFGSGSVYTPCVRRPMKDAAWPNLTGPRNETHYSGTIIHSGQGRYIHRRTQDLLALPANYAQSGMHGHMLRVLTEQDMH